MGEGDPDNMFLDVNSNCSTGEGPAASLTPSTFTTEGDATFEGNQILTGELWLLIEGPERLRRIRLTLYPNGLVLQYCDDETRPQMVALPPFAFVRTCCFGGSLGQMRMFKLSLFTQRRLFIFAVPEDGFGTDNELDVADEGIHGGICGINRAEQKAHQADMERSWWVLNIAHAIGLVSRSLFPSFSLQSKPEGGRAPHLLLGGYLLHQFQENVLVVLYAELWSHRQGRAWLVFYTSHKCDQVIDTVPIEKASLCREYDGIDCCCFSVNRHLLCARSNSEKILWIRAVTNLKVRLINEAPDPTAEQLDAFREEIQDQVLLVERELDTLPHSHPLLKPGFNLMLNQTDPCQGNSVQARETDPSVCSRPFVSRGRQPPSPGQETMPGAAETYPIDAASSATAASTAWSTEESASPMPHDFDGEVLQACGPRMLGTASGIIPPHIQDSDPDISYCEDHHDDGNDEVFFNEYDHPWAIPADDLAKFYNDDELPNYEDHPQDHDETYQEFYDTWAMTIDELAKFK